MVKDVSNQTVVVLVVLTILISVLGVATIFHETSKVNVDKTVSVPIEDKVTSGKITLNIVTKEEISSSGSIKLDIMQDDL